MITENLKAVWVLYRRTLRELIALGPQTLVAPLVVPSFVLFAYSIMFSEVFTRVNIPLVDTPGFGPNPHYVQYLIAAPIIMSALLGTASAGIGVAVERQLGFYDRMEISPLGPSVSQIARRLGDGTRIALFVIVLTFVGQAAGAKIVNWPLALGVTIPLAAALGMAYGGIAFSFCLRTGSAEAAQAVTPLFLPVLFMSTAFVPLPLIPQIFRPVVKYNPISSICDAVRSAYAGKVSESALLISIIEIGIFAMMTQILIMRAEHRLHRR
ncbi:MAG: ABC transporter permease [Terracidiphilus sp.]